MSPATPRAPRLGAWLAAAALLALGFAALVATPTAEAKAKNIRVMTRNLYLGADLGPALQAPTAVELYEEAANVYRSVHETNFPARARSLAREIAVLRPHLVGLQEVALWRRDRAGAPDGDATPAREVVYNFLAELRLNLARRGMPYRPVSVQREADFELPLDFDDDDAADVPAYDGRLTMFDVILKRVRGNVRTGNARSGNYQNNLLVPIPAPPGAVEVTRGWTSVAALVRGKRLQFVNTHLEAFSAFVRNQQAQELFGVQGPLTQARGKEILVGDLNSDPDDTSVQNQPPFPPTENSAAYETVIAEGFTDRGVGVDTCCHASDLLNPNASFGPDNRIDHVLTRGAGIGGRGAILVGDEQGNRTPHGLWPSDHGGVLSGLRVR